MRLLSLGLAALFTLIASGAVTAADTGTAVGVTPDAAARGTGGNRTLRVGSDIAVGETVVTDRRGQVQIVFADDTHLVVGPGSSLLIEQYLLRGNGTASTFAINALSGSFRFVTGKSPKAAYEIRTPTATIGVRGTAFDFTVDRLNLTTLVLFHGAVRLCTLDGECVTLSTRCQVGAADMLQALQVRAAASLRDQFPYIRSQRPLLVDFRVAGAEQCLPATSTATPGSLSENGGGGTPAQGEAPTSPPTTPNTTPNTPPPTTTPTTSPPCTSRVCN